MQTHRHKLKICQRWKLFGCRHVDTNSISTNETKSSIVSRLRKLKMCQRRELFGCRHADTQTQTQNLPEEGTCWLQTCRCKLIICREGRHFPEDMQTHRHKLRICQRRNFFYYRHVDTNSQSARERNFLAVDTNSKSARESNFIVADMQIRRQKLMLSQTENLPEKGDFPQQTQTKNLPKKETFLIVDTN